TLPASSSVLPARAPCATPRPAPPRSSPIRSGRGSPPISSPGREPSAMVALKSGEVDAFVARPDPARPIVLVFGPDLGLVRERAETILRASVDDPRDPFALVRLDGDDVAGDPARLVDEAQTVPLFGGRRAVHLRVGTRNIMPAVEALLGIPIRDCRIVIEAGD